MTALHLAAFTWQNVLLLATLLAGTALTLRGISDALGGVCQPRQNQRQILDRLEGFRRFVVGMALLGLAIGWATDATWLIVVAFGIGGEELFESSVIISAMKYGLRA